MTGVHARLSPSSASRWTSCTASPAEQDGHPNTGSEAARIGTTCHQMQEEILLGGGDANHLGQAMVFYEVDGVEHCAWRRDVADVVQRDLDIAVVTVTEEMVAAVDANVSRVRDLLATLDNPTLLIEQKVPIGQFTGEEGATGSADVVIVAGNTLYVCDAKYGRHKVMAFEDGRMNLQMASYALGALELHDPFGDITRVCVQIHQPLVDHFDSYECSVEELLEVRDFLVQKAEETRSNPKHVPTFDNCHFCRAKGNCSAQTQAVLSKAFDGFEDVDLASPASVGANSLGSLYAAIPMIRDWCNSIEAKAMGALEEGAPLVRNDGQAYKLVAGKATARKWRDETEAEEALNRMQIQKDLMWKRELITPTQAEKLTKVPKGSEDKPVIGKRRWATLQELIVQGQGKPQIVLASDARPALSKADDFEEEATPVANATTPVDDGEDLFG